MITCRDCQTEFPKPTTRGRPPVKCADCRTGKPKPAEFVAAEESADVILSITSQTFNETIEEEPRKISSKPTRSGFCNKRHAPEIHALCRTCTCDCHTS